MLARNEFRGGSFIFGLAEVFLRILLLVRLIVHYTDSSTNYIQLKLLVQISEM